MKTRLPLATLALLLAAPLVHAADFTWDPTLNPAAPVGGTGTWSTSDANWSDGAADSVWANATGLGTHNAVISASSTITLGSAVTVRNITNTGTTTISGGTLTLDSSANTGTGSGNAGPILSGGNLTISSIIAGTRGLAVNGGTVTLSGANTYTGNTLVSNGTLKIGADNALTTSTSLITFGSGRTFDLNGFNQQVASLQGSNGIVQNTGASASTLTINGSSNTSTGQSIRNSINLVKQGSSTLTLTGSQAGGLSFTGTTTVSDGTLRLSTASSGLTGSAGVTIDGGTLSSVAAGNLALGLGHVSMSAGAINPGESGVAASFTLAANQNFTATGGTLNFDLGASFDQIIGSGSGSFDLSDATLALAGDVSVAGTYLLFSGFSSGNVSNLAITGLDPGFTGSLSNTGLLTVAAIPEPSAFAALAGAAMLGLAALRRRRVSKP